MHKKVIIHLSKDNVLKSVIETTQLSRHGENHNVYEGLIRSIVSQQLSVKAGDTIHGRFVKLFKDHYPAPESLLRTHIETLRGVGLSRQKSAYIQNVAQFFKDQKIMEKDWSEDSDEWIVQYLSQIKGVGTWTVQMILMFTLRRPDVFPIDDLGIRNAMIRLYQLEDCYPNSSAGKKALYQKLSEIAAPWAPYRTTACQYLWRWLS